MHLIELIPAHPKDQPSGPEDKHGKGLIPSPPDARDYSLHDLLVGEGYLPEVLGAEEMLASFPTSFVCSTLPPVTNQGLTPQCVAYSSAMMKAWMDHRDQLAWFDFAEATFFSQIGGTSSGAILRRAFDQMKAYGYPPNAGVHRIAAYYAASLAHADLKAALMAYGPLILGVKWPSSWSHPYSTGVVPYPSGTTNGHAIMLVGWQDGMGFLFQNSWGTGWGVNGRCYIPARYLSSADGATEIRAFEGWKALDQVITTATYCTVKTGSRIRAAASGTGTLIATLGANTKLLYRGTLTGGSYNWWDGSKWVVRRDWAKVVYGGIERYVVRVNVIL